MLLHAIPFRNTMMSANNTLHSCLWTWGWHRMLGELKASKCFDLSLHTTHREENVSTYIKHRTTATTARIPAGISAPFHISGATTITQTRVQRQNNLPKALLWVWIPSALPVTTQRCYLHSSTCSLPVRALPCMRSSASPGVFKYFANWWPRKWQREASVEEGKGNRWFVE